MLGITEMRVLTLVPNRADRCFQACLRWTDTFPLSLPLLIEWWTRDELTASLFPLRDEVLGGVCACDPKDELLAGSIWP